MTKNEADEIIDRLDKLIVLLKVLIEQSRKSEPVRLSADDLYSLTHRKT
jgi:hypothetical protein